MLKEIHTQETFQQQKVLNRDTASGGQKTVPPASLVLQRKIAWSMGKGNPYVIVDRTRQLRIMTATSIIGIYGLTTSK